MDSNSYLAPGLWPDWELPSREDDATVQQSKFRELARYVSLASVQQRDLVDVGAAQMQSDKARTPELVLALTTRLYERLQPKLTYRLDPWTGHVGFQRIRDAGWILAEGGTCLDLALMFSALCIESNLRPFLVLIRGGAPHALVAVHPTWTADTNNVYRSHEAFALDAGDRAVISEELLPLDVWKAPFGATFDEVVAGGRALLRDSDPRDDVWVIDVAACHRDIGQLPAPGDARRITAFLPSMGDFIDFDSRRDVMPALTAHRATGGIVALVGPSGTGKSTLALQAARAADNGCGWFLDAADKNALIRSLAAAELRETGQAELGQATRGDDRDALSLAALARLRKATWPWTVVIDNADGPPERLRERLPVPNPDYRQLLIVTSTNRDWLQEADVAAIELAALDVGDLHGTFPDAASYSSFIRTPLSLNSFARLARELPNELRDRVEKVAGETERTDEASTVLGARIVWDVILSSSSTADQQVAAALGWVPPHGVPVEAMVDLGGDHTAASRALARFDSLGGLIVDTSGTVRVHRLFGSALRDIFHAEATANVESLLSLPQTLDIFDESDDATLAELENRLGDRGGGNRRAIAWHTMGRLRELHGRVEQSAWSFGRAIEALEGTTANSDRGLIADCHHGRARWEFQGNGDLTTAMSWTSAAQDLYEQEADAQPPNSDASNAARTGYFRAMALAGNITRKQSSEQGRHDDRVGMIHDALAMISRADEGRRALLQSDDPELARSRYNFAAIYLNLAKVAPPDQVADLLASADGVYREVKETRDLIYRRRIHPHIACCTWGRGLIAYYRALLLPTLDAPSRLGFLREATPLAAASLEDRQLLDGSLDGNDSRKSAELLTKVLMVRGMLSATPTLSAESPDFWLAIDESLDSQLAGISSLVPGRT